MSCEEENRPRCLILFESYRKEELRKLPVPIANARVYALVAERQMNDFQDFFNRYSRQQIHIINNGEDPTGLQSLPENLTFEILDFEFSYRDAGEESDRAIPLVDIDEINKHIMKSLLGRMSYTTCHNDVIRDTDPRSYISPSPPARFFTTIDENIAFIEKLLGHGAELVYRRRNRETLLHFAVRMDSESLVNTLLRFNFDANAKRYDGLTPLHIAAKRGHLEILLTLIRHGASVLPPIENYRGLTPLMLASKRGHANVVRALLSISYQTGSVNDINAGRSPDGRSCLHMAAWSGYSATLEILLQHGANVNAKTVDGSTPLVLARGNKVLEILLRAGSEVDTIFDSHDGRRSALFDAVAQSELRKVQLILAHHPDPNNYFNKLAFYQALASQTKGFKAAVELMYRIGFTVDDESLGTLDEAKIMKVLFGAIVKNCHKAVSAVLMSRNIVNLTALPDLPSHQFSCTSLHLASVFGDEEMLEILLDHHADVNAHDEDGKTPLFHAVAAAKVDSVKFLIAHKADVDNQPELVYAAIYRREPLIMEILLLNGAKVNEPYDGETIKLPIKLRWMCTPNNPDAPTHVTIKIPNHSPREPPIYYAAVKGNSAIVKIMLKYGALKISESEHCRSSPLKRAADHKQLDIFRTFLDYEFPKTLASCGLDIGFLLSLRSRDYITVVIIYLIKIKCCDVQVSVHYHPNLWTLPLTMDEFRASCESEVSRLRSDKLEHTDVSYYDILMQSVSTVSGYARNNFVVDAFRSGEIKERFPIYASIIESQFEKGYHRRCLITSGVTICCILIDQFKDLPDNLKDGIIDYLDNHALQYLRSSSSTFFREE